MRWKCPYHDEYFNSVVELAKHIDEVIKRNYVNPNPNQDGIFDDMLNVNTLTHSERHTKPSNVPAQRGKKLKDKRPYNPMATEVNMGKDVVHTGYANSENEISANIQSGVQYPKTPTKDDARRVKRSRSAPMKRRSWKRRFSGSAFPYPNRNMTPEIMAVQSSLENYVIDYYDSTIDEIEKSLEVTGLDNELKDKMVSWLNKMLGVEINKMGVDSALEIADEAGYLDYFKDNIVLLQIEKMIVINRKV